MHELNMRVLILISDTGGGHRAAGVAIEEALRRLDPTIEIIVRDALVETATWPFAQMPWFYPVVMKHFRWLYALIFHATNGARRSRFLADVSWMFVARKMRELITKDK